MENTNSLKHVFVIPDGNRRWARENKKTYKEVYEKVAMEITPNLIEEVLLKQGVQELTIFMLSRSNLIKRSLDEVLPILKAQERLYGWISENKVMQKSGASFKVIGDKTLLPRSYLDACERLEKINHGKKKCNFLVGYDAEWELLQAVKKIERIESADIVKELALNSEIDLMIRTGFEHRISGGPLIQLKFAELVFCDFHYPELTRKKIQEIIKQYGKKERRFGR
ncbi:undecaprenyl diphosphate synthase family protein [Candidatus Micrarchaeota archaeon]|nr:undecaprenyl diphosphate synthase family protein [Candidatus Micrarchaeota archaeon]